MAAGSRALYLPSRTSRRRRRRSSCADPHESPGNPILFHADSEFMGVASLWENSHFWAYPHKTEWFRFFASESRPGANERKSFRTGRSEEHTSELQSLMRNSYAVFC